MVIDSPIVSGSYNGTGSFEQRGNVVISGSLTVTGPVIGSLTGSVDSASFATTAISSSFAFSSTSSSFASNAVNATTASYVLNAVSSSFATTATSASFAATASSADAFTVRGTLTAQTINVQTITSSVDFVTGSTRFGSILSNTHQFTGSVGITGSLSVNGTSAVVGTGTTGQVAYFNGTNSITSESNLFWDAANDRLGIGTNTPQSNIDIRGTSSRLRLDASSSSFQILSRNTGDTSTNALIFDADTYTYNRGGVFRMTLDASGNLGLGVTPSAWGSSYKAMQISSGAAFYGITSDARYAVMSANQFDNGSGNIYLANGASTLYVQGIGQHIWYTAASGTAGNAITFTQAMTLDASGRLLVGFTTNQTGAALQVSGAGTFSSTLRATEITASMPSGNGALYINNSSLTNKNWTFIPETSSGETNLLLFYTGASAGTRMTITSGGNVGIGTTNPLRILHVRGGAGTAQIESTSATSMLYFGDTNSTGIDNRGIGSAGNDLWFMGGGLERMRITSGGNVGIGTTSPNVKFEVEDGYIGTYHNANVNGAGYGFNFYTNGGGSKNTIAAIYPSQDGTARSGHLTFLTSNSGAPTERMRITSGGNVLVGTTTDNGQRLQVNGTSYLNGNTQIQTTAQTTVTVPSGQATVINTQSGTIVTYQGGFSSPYTQNIQIDIQFTNWGGNPTVALVDTMFALREYSATPGFAYGKIFARQTSATATFSTFDTSNITADQCTVTASSGGNYTLRIVIDPTNVTDIYGIYLNIMTGGSSGNVSSVTISLV